jgi:hypothetical protein
LCLSRGRMSWAIFITNLLLSRRGPTLMAVPRKLVALMGASSLPLAKASQWKLRVRQILQPSDRPALVTLP